MAAEPQSQRVHLSQALAQRIVDELTPALQENLNLMDAHGVIVASNDASRVGTLHPGAREAAATNSVVTVEAGSARSGERAGVNVPLEHRGTVIGVVGVTGEPAKVRSLAPVLALTIGLLFEREAELAGESQRDARDRDLLARLVYGARPQDAVGLLARRAPRLTGPWQLSAVVDAAGAPGGIDATAAARVRELLGAQAVVGALRGVLWVLAGGVALARGSGSGLDAGAAALPNELSAILPTASILHSDIAVTDASLASEAGTLATLSTRSALWAVGEVRAARTLQLPLVAAHLPEGAAATLVVLLDGVTPGERETLAAYLGSGVAAEASRSGYAHRNTVRRRLASIAERTGFDVRVPEQAAILALALAAEQELTYRSANKVHSAPTGE